MFRHAGRGFAFGLGFWLAPIVVAVLIAGVGIAAGFASTERHPEVIASVDSPTTPPDGPPIAKPVAAPKVNSAEGTVVRIGRLTTEGRVIFVQDAAGRTFQMLVRPNAVVKKGGQRIRPAALAVGDRLVGVGARDKNGLFRAVGISVVPQDIPPTR